MGGTCCSTERAGKTSMLSETGRCLRSCLASPGSAFVYPDIERQCWRLPSSNGRPNHSESPLCPNFFCTKLPKFTMSHAPSASTSSSNFQPIFDAALKAYEKKTKKDLLAHPLMAQLQACKSPGDILAVLQKKVNEFDQSRGADERLSQWLDPTINVLYSFTAALGAGVGLVSTLKLTCLLIPLIVNIAGILAGIRHLLWHWGSPPGERALRTLCRGDSHNELCHRQPKTSRPAKKP